MRSLTGIGAPLARTRLSLSTLELFMPHGWPERAGPVYWCLGGSSAAHGRAEDLEQLPPNLKWAALIVWTPPADTLLTQAVLPTRSSRKIAQALPYALEDQLLVDPEQLHFAHQRMDDGALAVAVTARARLQSWLQALHAAGLQPGSLCPATLAVPMDVDDWSAACVEEWLWIRRGPYAGFTCAVETDAPPRMLQAALAEARAAQQAPGRLTLFNAPADLDLPRWQALLGMEVRRARGPLWEERIASIAPLNLLQGEFAPGRGMRSRLQPLAPAAAMLAAWVAATVALDAWEWWGLRHTQRDYEQAMSALFRQTFPEAKVVLDPALQMERNLQSLRARSGQPDGSGLLPVLARVAPAFGAGVELRALRYADAKLTLDMRLPDFEALERTKNAMTAAGKLRVEVLGATRQTGGVDGRLRVEAAGASTAGGR